MNKEELIKKWLNNELTAKELEAFKKLEDYDELMNLNKGLQHFKAEEFNSSKEFEEVLDKIKNSKKKASWLKPFLRVAALFAVILSVYFYKSTLNTEIITQIAHKETIELPDASQVIINSKSLLSYNKKNWKKERIVNLEGEAFFKVEKGSTFSVITETGTVTVYGTQFNVKQRENYFEVICYEGSVGVTYNSEITTLKPGQQFLVLNENRIKKDLTSNKLPPWTTNVSQFQSLPFKQVLFEFERQYDVTFEYKNINTTQLFTGSFSHKDINVALKSITLPLNLTYNKSGKIITLKSD